MREPTGPSRTVILDRIQRTNSQVDLTSRIADFSRIPRIYDQSSATALDSLLTLFTERLLEYDAVVHESRHDEVSATIQAVLATNGQRSFIAAEDFPHEWLPRDIQGATGANTAIEAMNHTDGALVTCEVAIAHTGTIVLKGSRRLTLLPDRLLCVIREDQVVETVPEAFARLQPLAVEPLTFISGPSATADIEMTRIRGVHGPRFLDVVLVRYNR